MTSDKINSSSNLKRTAGILFSFILTAVLLFFAFNNVDISSVTEIISNASLLWIFIFILVNLISHYIRAVRWKIILSSVKKDTSVKNLFGALMVGYGVNCVIPRLGEVARAVVLGRWENLSRTSMFGTVIIERVIDLISLAIAVFISVLIYGANLYENFPWLETALFILSGIMLAAILFFIILIRYKAKFLNLIVFLIEKISKKLAGKVAHVFQLLVDGFASLKGTKNYIYTFLLSVIIMIVYAGNAYVGFYILGMENSGETSFSVAWILMSISAIGVVIPTPGATGSYHLLTTKVLVLLFGFSQEISAAYAVITHAISYVIFISTSVISFFVLNSNHKKSLKEQEKEFIDLFKTNPDKP